MAEKHVNLSLGIDIGTTSVKVCIVDKVHVIESFTESHNASCTNNRHEQCPYKIVKCLAKLLEQLNNLNEIATIHLTGQMHGIIFWRATNFEGRVNLDNLSSVEMSNLFTWEDTRCTREFLNTLSCIALRSGFGLATFLWLLKNSTTFDVNCYTQCGTIMDFVVWLLTGGGDVYMSLHNAESWGYFNQGEWDFQLLERDCFSMSKMLPKIVATYHVVGESVTIESKIPLIPKGAKVYVALGDLQCSIRGVSPTESEAVLNFGTSCQLSMLVPRDNNDVIDDVISNCSAVTLLQYSSTHCLLTAASLNGGNVIETFATTLSNWCCSIIGKNITKEQVIEKLLSLGSTQEEDNAMKFLFTERHTHTGGLHIEIPDPLMKSPISLSCTTRALLRSLAENLALMFPRESLVKNNVTSLVTSSGIVEKSSALNQSIVAAFDLPIRFTGESKNASLGAVLFNK